MVSDIEVFVLQSIRVVVADMRLFVLGFNIVRHETPPNVPNPREHEEGERVGDEDISPNIEL